MTTVEKNTVLSDDKPSVSVYHGTYQSDPGTCGNALSLGCLR